MAFLSRKLLFSGGTFLHKVSTIGSSVASSKTLSSYCFLFPGQGSQKVGMCHDLLLATEKGKLPQVAAMFDLAENTFKVDFRKLFLDGPKSTLDETVHCQPAVVLASLAALESFREENRNEVECRAAAGFSIGEITALIAAGSLTLTEGFSLIKVRGEAMQEACKAEESCMVTVSRLEEDSLKEIIKSFETFPSQQVCVGIYLCPGRSVVSGSVDCVRSVVEEAKKLGAVSKRVSVAGAFHSELMSPAVPKLRAALDRAALKMPNFPLYSNVTGQPYSSVNEIRKNLALQVTQPVLWHHTIQNMIHKYIKNAKIISKQEEVTKFIEIGPNNHLKTLLKYINETAYSSCTNVSA